MFFHIWCRFPVGLNICLGALAVASTEGPVNALGADGRSVSDCCL